MGVRSVFMFAWRTNFEVDKCVRHGLDRKSLLFFFPSGTPGRFFFLAFIHSFFLSFSSFVVSVVSA